MSVTTTRNHPLWTIKRFADAALLELSPLFDEIYASDGQGRASIPPERLLFRWFLDMGMLEPSLAGYRQWTEAP